MDNPRQPSLEARESGETAENTGQQKLDDATFEPLSYVEQAGDHRQAEAIQNSLTALVENAQPAEETVTAVPPHVPVAADRSKVTASPGKDEGEKVDAIPITVPDVKITEGKPTNRPGEAISATPITLPDKGVQPAGDEVSATPITLPGKGSQPAGDEISATPITLPGKGSQSAGDEISATPITLPDAKTDGDQISTMPIPIPDGSAQPARDEISATPITLPDKGAQPAGDLPSETPTNLQKEKAPGWRSHLPGTHLPGGETGGMGGRPSPAFTLDGKGTDRSPDAAGEVSSAALQNPEANGEPGEPGSSAQAIDAEDSFKAEYLKHMAKINKDNQSFTTSSDIKKEKPGKAKDSIDNIR
jgi:hypothetical protein